MTFSVPYSVQFRVLILSHEILSITFCSPYLYMIGSITSAITSASNKGPVTFRWLFWCSEPRLQGGNCCQNVRQMFNCDWFLLSVITSYVILWSSLQLFCSSAKPVSIVSRKIHWPFLLVVDDSLSDNTMIIVGWCLCLCSCIVFLQAAVFFCFSR